MPACTKISCSSEIQACRAGLWCRKLCYPVNKDNLNKPLDIKGICIYEFILLELPCYYGELCPTEFLFRSATFKQYKPIIDLTIPKDSTRQALGRTLNVNTKQLCSLESLSAFAACLVPSATRPLCLVVETLLWQLLGTSWDFLCLSGGMSAFLCFSVFLSLCFRVFLSLCFLLSGSMLNKSPTL